MKLPSPLPGGEQCWKKQCWKMSYIQSCYLPKRKAQVWFYMVARRQPQRCGLSNTDTSSHLNSQRVEHRSLHFWMLKAKQEAKLILAITYPEWHKNHSHQLGGGGHVDHKSSSLPFVQAQGAELSGAYFLQSTFLPCTLLTALARSILRTFPDT